MGPDHIQKKTIVTSQMTIPNLLVNSAGERSLAVGVAVPNNLPPRYNPLPVIAIGDRRSTLPGSYPKEVVIIQ